MEETTAMEWRQCIGFSSYDVSEYGDVRRRIPVGHRLARGRVRGTIDKDGYHRCHIIGDDGHKYFVPVHQLVANAFIGPAPSDEYEVAHRNGSRIFSHFSNLRWALCKSNQADRLLHGTDPKGERNGRSQICATDVIVIRREFESGCADARELAARFGLTVGHIHAIRKGRSWAHIKGNNIHV